MRCNTSVRLGHSVDDAWRSEDATLLLNDMPWVDKAENISAMLYLLGYDGPRYPVPAIRYEADIYPANIRVWEWKRGEGWVHVRKFSRTR